MSTGKRHVSTGTILRLAMLCAAAMVYLVTGLTNLQLPGPQNDEVADAVPALELLHGLPSSAFNNVDLFGTRLPLVMGHYTGPSSIVESYVGMALFGTTIAGLRTAQLLLGALTLLLLWLLARGWFGATVAALAVLLCATAPAFIWWSRSGAHFAAPLLPLALVLLILLRQWWRTQHHQLLIAVAFVFGLGVTTKLLFIWLLVPIGVMALLMLGPGGILRKLRRIPLGIYALSAFAFTVGLLPFILHNIPSGASFRFIGENALESRAYSHNNLDFLGNLQFEILDFLRMMSGDTLHFDAPSPIPLGALAVIGSVIYTLVLCITNLRAMAISGNTASVRVPTLRARLFLLSAIIGIIPLATISISSIGARHLFIIVPLTWLLVAVSIADLAAFIRKRISFLLSAIAAFGVVAILLSNHIATNVNLHAFMVATGGKGLWSDSLYALTDRLQMKYGDRKPIALDWGFERSVAFLTQGRTRLQEMFEYLPKPSPLYLDVTSVMLRDSSHLYILHSPEVTQFHGYLQSLQRAAMMQRKQLVAVETLYERDSTPSIVLYTSQPLARRFIYTPAQATRNAIFDGGLVLLGGEVVYNAVAREVSISLHWQNQADAQPDDVVLVHIVNQDTGDVVVAADKEPVYGTYPFSVWDKDEVVTDPHWVDLPDAVPPGIYQVRIGVYNRISGERRAIADPLNDAAGNSLMLNSFTVP